MKNTLVCYVGSVLAAAIMLLCSCGDNGAAISIPNEKTLRVPLLEWKVLGLLPDTDTVGDMLEMAKCSKKLYAPRFNQFDLREVYGIGVADSLTNIIGKNTLVYKEIKAARDMDVYVEVKTTLDCIHIMNGDTLQRRNIDGMEVYPVHLRKGGNDYVVKMKAKGDDLSFEATIYDSLSIARLYTEMQYGKVIYPQIDSVSHDEYLVNQHQNVLDAPAVVRLYDVMGKRVGRDIVLKRGVQKYHFYGIRSNMAYKCELMVSGCTALQPVICGKDDNIYDRYKTMRDKLPSDCPRIYEIDQLLARFKFLLNHPSRKDGDWWWQFKITPLAYQLEHTFAHLGGTHGDDDTEAGLLFVTYRSQMDDSLQRYVLARPRHIDRKKPLPLVIVMRPNIVNLYPFFCSPQVARQWALDRMQALADRFKVLIVMPEIRTYLDEDLLPKAEEELKLAIKDVCKHYPVDTTHLFLHANCSGGYRALRMATDYPTMFRAVALYAPVYERHFAEEWSMRHAPKLGMAKLAGVPMMICGDPTDRHSPISMYRNLIEDCEKYDIPLTLLLKRNAGKAYNVELVGEDALEFFSTIDRQDEGTLGKLLGF